VTPAAVANRKPKRVPLGSRAAGRQRNPPRRRLRLPQCRQGCAVANIAEARAGSAMRVIVLHQRIPFRLACVSRQEGGSGIKA